jgi:hypothetical protein
MDLTDEMKGFQLKLEAILKELFIRSMKRAGKRC